MHILEVEIVSTLLAIISQSCFVLFYWGIKINFFEQEMTGIGRRSRDVWAMIAGVIYPFHFKLEFKGILENRIESH